MSLPPVKWIKLARQQCALNADDVGGLFPMSHSFKIERGTSIADMIAKVPQGIKHLVFNCHGFISSKSYMRIGENLNIDNVSACAPLMDNSVRVIWLSSCNIGYGEGLQLCKQLALVTGCFVVTQTLGVPDRKMKRNCVEDYYYAMPQYIDPWGEQFPRTVFLTLQDHLNFKVLDN